MGQVTRFTRTTAIYTYDMHTSCVYYTKYKPAWTRIAISTIGYISAEAEEK